MEIRTYTVDTYKDIPVPYAIFKIIYADDGNVANTQYVYVNEAYCQTAGIRREDPHRPVFSGCVRRRGKALAVLLPGGGHHREDGT